MFFDLVAMSTSAEVITEVLAMAKDPWKALLFKEDPNEYCNRLAISDDAKEQLSTAREGQLLTHCYNHLRYESDLTFPVGGSSNIIIAGFIIINLSDPPPSDDDLSIDELNL